MGEAQALQRACGMQPHLRSAVLVALCLLLADCAGPSSGAGSTPALAPARADGDFAQGYVGSQQCAACHEQEYRDWAESLHSRMEQLASPRTVLGAWTTDGAVVPTEVEGRSIVMVRDGDAFYVEAPGADGRRQRYAVSRTVGNRYKQGYLTRFADGSWHPLPVMWLERDGKFVEWKRLASTEPGSGAYWTDEAWQWQLKCAGCHTTGLDLGYDTARRTYTTRWKELAIGCEACHGPGRDHVEARGGTGNIRCPSDFTLKRQLDTCGRCHSRGTAGPGQGAPPGLPGKLAYPYNMLPGEPLDDRFAQVTPGNSAHDFWPDGSSFNHHQQLNDYRKAPMLLHGGSRAPSCTTCHDPHRADALKAPIEDNSLCLGCHKELRGGEALAAHTGHGSDPVANPGARCVECHMPRIVAHAGSQRLRSHTYWSPDPRRIEGDTKTPEACVLCHTDRDRAWALESAKRLWPEGMDYR